MRDRIGRLDQRITFQSATLTADGAGGNTKTWSDVATTWAHVIAKVGAESFTENRMNATGFYVFVIRSRSDVDETMRIVWRGENYNIRAILRKGYRSHFVDIEVERGVGT